MLKNMLTSLLILGFLGSSSFAAGAQQSTFQEEFLNAARSLSEAQIVAKLQQPDIAQENGLERYGAILHADHAHRSGLITLAQLMCDTGPFFRNYKKIILSALLDFKRYSVNDNLYSLRPGEAAPLLFNYVNPTGQRISVTTYSFVYLILDQLQKALDQSLKDMNSVRYHDAAVKVKKFLQELSEPQ